MRAFCCLGCQAVAQYIVDGGLASFYQYRDQPSRRPALESPQWTAFDDPAIQAGFVTPLDNVQSGAADQRVAIALEGITCAACVWLIEQRLRALPGVSRVSLSATLHTASVELDSKQLAVSQVFTTLAQLGFKPSPRQAHTEMQQLHEQHRQSLLRLGVAGLGMMQAGMASIALHLGGSAGIESEWHQLLRWVSWLAATPVLLYSGLPFFRAAWRGLKARHWVMDIPVSIALVLAYSASAWATLSQSGDVYFDSVAMFVFFLLLGRFIESRLRYQNVVTQGPGRALLPLWVDIQTDAGLVVRPLAQLQPGDSLWVQPGMAFPCDGQVIDGQGTADESWLTGESRPQAKVPGSRVVAGTLNRETRLGIRATAVGEATQLAAIERLIESAGSQKPHFAALADRYAGLFVSRILLVTLVVGLFWLFYAPERALWVVLSVLVVTCPCALSLATPTALAAALQRARRLGLLVSRAQLFDVLPTITDVIFDKTGTLTQGAMRVVETQCLLGSGADALAIAAALERASRHPIATALAPYDRGLTLEKAEVHLGFGVTGQVDGIAYRFGKPHFACPNQPNGLEAGPLPPSQGQWVLLARLDGPDLGGADSYTPVLWCRLDDPLREGAALVLQSLALSGLRLHLVSGDSRVAVDACLERLGPKAAFVATRADQTPDDKLTYLQTLRQGGAKVLMLGDGINDVPVLAAADASIAVGALSDLTRLQADAVLLGQRLDSLVTSLTLSRSVGRVIRQNLAWAIVYNLMALPIAACGWVPPWLAAIGMSTSSLVVVLNAMRLGRQSG